MNGIILEAYRLAVAGFKPLSSPIDWSRCELRDQIAALRAQAKSRVLVMSSNGRYESERSLISSFAVPWRCRTLTLQRRAWIAWRLTRSVHKTSNFALFTWVCLINGLSIRPQRVWPLPGLSFAARPKRERMKNERMQDYWMILSWAAKG